jgi:hypothetical protein
MADRLTAKGHYVVAPTLSGVGERSHLKAEDINLTTQIDDVVGEIEWKDLNDVVLVGHSYGGMVITYRGDCLSRCVPSGGWAVACGLHYADFVAGACNAAVSSVGLSCQRQGCSVGAGQADGASDAMLYREAEGDGSVSVDCEKALCASAVVCAEGFDQAQERCRADASWQTTSVTCGHHVMIDQPAELAEMLEKFA